MVYGMAYKVFVDGQEGTTGLKINERLRGRDDIELLVIDPGKRKDVRERKNIINESDIPFCACPTRRPVNPLLLLKTAIQG